VGTKLHGSRAQEQAARNLRTGLILAAIALAFGVGFVVRVWLTG
jgi:hypothetical protein